MFDILDPVEKILISEEEIKERVKALGDRITKDYEGKEITFLGILSGSFIFLADLVRAVNLPVQIDFMYASSYGEDTESKGNVQINNVKGFDPTGKDIIIIEDIIDSGRTLSKIKKHLLDAGASSVEICSFLDKPSRRVVEVDAKYIGYEVPDEFVIGYGLDFAYKYRQYPFVGVLKREYYE